MPSDLCRHANSKKKKTSSENILGVGSFRKTSEAKCHNPFTLPFKTHILGHNVHETRFCHPKSHLWIPDGLTALGWEVSERLSSVCICSSQALRLPWAVIPCTSTLNDSVIPQVPPSLLPVLPVFWWKSTIVWKGLFSSQCRELNSGFTDKANAPGAKPFCFEETGSLCCPESPDDLEWLYLVKKILSRKCAQSHPKSGKEAESYPTQSVSYFPGHSIPLWLTRGEGS